ncbi:NAD(P)H-dependent oxidoreductase [Thiomicrorhabdus heinhorstiae]|uniref:NAD(P)H-dependent oxidoreductase n=1 Tax=Thiomicrorhabdus heinhorstiae TaxID=2748010 RepID=A0ABS0BY29_9GAMM|nr:NAD(P)H-dependent oxidoreductase [Thiomicrorhabdus heinhorstiae]MBF6058707.1 NAD(P)H-dependent oxidoreductase [Thiomicrorhabdus heinhorstiae]
MNQVTLIFNAHPDKDSFCNALAQTYFDALLAQDKQVQLVHLSELHFSPNAHHPAIQTELETDLSEIQDAISQAQRIVLVYPIWWGGMPALLKAFLDRVLTPGFAFQYTDQHRSIGLLHDKKIEIINTTDSPSWLQWWLLRGDKHQQKVNIWGFCGAKISHYQRFGPIFSSTEKQRTKWLQDVKDFAQ